MELTIEFLRNKFTEFNNRYYNGALMEPSFELFKSRRLGGQYSWGNGMPGKIRINVYYKRDERSYCEILLHEMIHLYIRQNKIKDNRAHHGSAFKREMSRINSFGDYNVTLHCDSKGLECDAPEGKEYFIGSYKVKGKRRFVFVISKNRLEYYQRLFMQYPLHFSDAVIFTSKNSAEFDSYSQCRRSIRGWYKTEEEFKALFDEHQSLVYKVGNKLCVA